MAALASSPTGRRSSAPLNVRVQRAGFVYKLPFRRGGSGKWKKRYFVLKDGYLLYYSKPKPESVGRFDIHPKGVLPLGDSTCIAYETGLRSACPPGYFAFKVTHPNFGGGSLVACVEGEQARNEWIKALKDCSRVTWDAAILGDQKITELRNKGNKLEQEKKQKLEQAEKQALEAKLLKEKTAEELRRFEESASLAQEKASELNSVRQKTIDARKAAEAAKESLQAMEEAQKELMKTKSGIDDKVEQEKNESKGKLDQLREAQERARELAEQAEETQRRLEEEEAAQEKREKALAKEVDKQEKLYASQLAELERAQKERQAMEQRVRDAESSLADLDAKIRKSGIKANIEVSADVKSLRSFFAGRINELKAEASKADTNRRRLQNAVSAFSSAKKKVAAAPTVAATTEESLDAFADEIVAEVEEDDDVVVDDDDDDEAQGEDSDMEDSEVVVARANEVFDAVDKDGDGMLSYDEFLAGVENGSLDFDSEETKKQLYDAIDADEDGKVSRLEFVEYFECYEDYMSDAFSAFLPSLPGIDELEEATWYYVDSAGETAGPHALADLEGLYSEGTINDSSAVWCEELDDWFSISDVSGMVDRLKQ